MQINSEGKNHSEHTLGPKEIKQLNKPQEASRGSHSTSTLEWSPWPCVGSCRHQLRRTRATGIVNGLGVEWEQRSIVWGRLAEAVKVCWRCVALMQL